MKFLRYGLLVTAVLAMTFLGNPSLRAEDAKSDAPPASSDAAPAATPAAAHAATPAEVSSRMQELQDEMDRIQGEMANLKKQLGVKTTSASPLVAAPTTLAAQADSAPAAPAASTDSAGPSLASILGPTNVSGLVDTYYGYNLNQPQGQITSFHPFDSNNNQFSLNMIELTVAKAPDASNSRLGYNLTFGFGNAMNVVNSSDPAGLGYAQYLKEGYISYLAPVGKGLQIDFGKFVTPAGAEVIETNGNWNYSRGILFNYAIPFYHFGIRAKYAFSDSFSATGYVMNGWNSIIDNNSGKTYGTSLAWSPTKKVSIIQNYLAGPETPLNNSDRRQLADTVVTYTPTSKVSLMANYDYGRGDANPNPALSRKSVWTGIAGYVRYAFSDSNALAVRYEYYDDRDGFTTGAPQHFNEFTGTYEHTVAKHLITRWEYRRDMANSMVFAKGSSFSDHQDIFTGGLIYVFDLKEMH
jgi:Putative beta-barrel porin-2, OmpL-like. bbp2